MAERREHALAMLAAAALVKVMQRIFSGTVPASIRRMTRLTSTCVLPDPALAATKADTAGSEASVCAALTSGGMTRLMRRLQCRRSPTIP